jgi:hemoglobin
MTHDACRNHDAPMAETGQGTACVAMEGPTQDARFDRLGGADAVTRLVDTFYARMDASPEAAIVRAMHRDDLAPTKAVLTRYLTEWLGGPPLYSRERGHPRLRRRHLGFSIGPRERDAWMACMRGAAETVVADETMRGELLAAFSKLADWLRNDKDNAHDKHR